MTNVAVLAMDCYNEVVDVTKQYNMESGETIRIMQDYDGQTYKLEEGHNSLNAYGLLVQNGYPTSTLFSLSAQQELEKLRAEGDLWISSDESIPWTDSKIASYNSAQKLFRCNECECVGFLSRVAEHWLGTHANLRVFQCPQCPYASAWARCVRMHLARQHNICPDPNQESLTLWKENPVLEEVTKYLERLKNLVEGELNNHIKEEEEEEEVHQNAIATQTSTPPPDSPDGQQSLSPDSQLEQEDIHEQEMQEQEMHQHELHQQELHQQELHHRELHQQELHQQELRQQELHQQDLHQQELHQQELHEQELHHQELQQQEIHQRELHQQELEEEYHQQELHERDIEEQQLRQQELEQHELEEQELNEQELRRQQHLEEELHHQEIHEQNLQQDISEQELQESQAQETQITHVIEEHIQVPEEIAKQLQQLAAAHGGGDIHPQLQIVITQQENQDLPPTIQIQIAQPQDLSNHLVSTSQQTIPLDQALSQSLASTISQQVLSQSQVIAHQPIAQQVIVQQPQVIQTTVAVAHQEPSPVTAPTSTSKCRSQTDCSTSTIQKRYNCTVCCYATDRRDLYTRHENIHRDEKPFHCYSCRKQFNRADHVKKHFLRMHRDIPYDINKIRRTAIKDPPNSTSTIQYFPKPQPRPPPPIIQQVETTTVESLSVPGFSTQKVIEDDKKNPRKKLGEKRHSCPYCSWTGVDNWCLKRHLNTHLKPFVCTLCEYKAARAERLTTHLFKVHNKKACLRCTFLADDQAQLSLHQRQVHNTTYSLPHSEESQKVENLDSKMFYIKIQNKPAQENNGNLLPGYDQKNSNACEYCLLLVTKPAYMCFLWQSDELSFLHKKCNQELVPCPPSSDEEKSKCLNRIVLRKSIDHILENNKISGKTKTIWKKHKPSLLSCKPVFREICQIIRNNILPHNCKFNLFVIN